MRKRLRYAAKAVKAQKRRNKVLKAQHEMELFSKLEKNYKQKLEFMSLMQEKAPICARAEVENAKKGTEMK